MLHQVTTANNSGSSQKLKNAIPTAHNAAAMQETTYITADLRIISPIFHKCGSIILSLDKLFYAKR